MRYSEKEKIRVVKMYYELGSIQKAIQKLGYPKRRNMVYKWIEEYKKTGRIKDKRSNHDIKQYTEEEKAFAVRFYHENHGSYQNVANELGYPSAAQLRLWVERAEKDCKITPHMIEYTKENFIKAAVEFCTDDPPPIAARFNISSFDVEIDGHKKTNYQGLGYCAFINTVTALVFRKYFADTAQYDPGFLIVDTPLLGLDQGVDDAAPESMRTGLFCYIMKQKDIGQIIILENLKHIPKLDFESEGVNLITFTKGYSEGRYGFLNDVT